jgi:flagellar motility protein MotE (MotC chaperone)
LEQLEDGEIQAIVGGLSDKQAAAILQALPPQRAAAISRAALRTGVREP